MTAQTSGFECQQPNGKVSYWTGTNLVESEWMDSYRGEIVLATLNLTREPLTENVSNQIFASALQGSS